MVSTHLKLVFAFIGYINAGDRENIAKLLSDNFVNEGRPASVGPLGIPAGKEAYLNRILNQTLIDYFNVSFEYVYPPYMCPDAILQRYRCLLPKISLKPKM